MKGRKKYIGAIDVGGTKIASALFTLAGQGVFRSRAITAEAGGQEAVEQIISLHLQLEAEAKRRNGRLIGIGLCVPGVVNPKTGLVWAPNIRGWKDFPLVRRLKNQIKTPVSVISDRTAYVLGEAWKGSACGKKNVIYLAVGTGIGAGIMAEGLVVHGQGDLAGAAGWMALNREFKEEYRELGCFEWEASGGALARKAGILVQSHPDIFSKIKENRSESGSESGMTAIERVCLAARRRVPLALKLVEEIQDYLAMGVANLVSTLNPEVVVLGGGLFQSADLFFEPVKEKFKLWAQPLASKSVSIVLSALGQEAALYGCARAALEEHFRKKL
jgi:glucokinase